MVAETLVVPLVVYTSRHGGELGTLFVIQMVDKIQFYVTSRNLL